MKLSHMKIQPILWLCALAGAFAPASAIEWEILRFDGRDYVTLESFAAHVALILIALGLPAYFLYAAVRKVSSRS